MSTSPAPSLALPANGTLDGAVIGRYRQLRKGFLEKLIGAYLEHTPATVQSLRVAAAKPDFAAVKATAHTLKSSSANLGALRLAEHCQLIEHAAQAGDRPGVTEMMRRISVEYFDVEESLKALLLQLMRAAAV